MQFITNKIVISLITLLLSIAGITYWQVNSIRQLAIQQAQMEVAKAAAEAAKEAELKARLEEEAKASDAYIEKMRNDRSDFSKINPFKLLKEMKAAESVKETEQKARLEEEAKASDDYIEKMRKAPDPFKNPPRIGESPEEYAKRLQQATENK